MNTTISARTAEGQVARSIVGQTDNTKFVLNTTGQNGKKIINFLRFFLKPLNVGTVKSAGEKNGEPMFLWIPGRNSIECDSSRKQRVVTLKGLIIALNASQNIYNFGMVFNTLLKVKVL